MLGSMVDVSTPLQDGSNIGVCCCYQVWYLIVF
jgi:hypothetical protein